MMTTPVTPEETDKLSYQRYSEQYSLLVEAVNAQIKRELTVKVFEFASFEFPFNVKRNHPFYIGDFNKFGKQLVADFTKAGWNVEVIDHQNDDDPLFGRAIIVYFRLPEKYHGIRFDHFADPVSPEVTE